MAIYDKTTRDLMHDFARQRLKTGQVFSRQDAARWFSEHYPKIKSNTAMIHVEAMSTNSRMRKHHPHIRAEAGWDLFYKMNPKDFRLYDPQSDPKPIYKPDIEAMEAGGATLDPVEESEDDESSDGEGSRKFAFERDLQNYLVRNLSALEPGLRLYEDEDGQLNGVEYPVGQRYIDILAVGSDGAFVVIETKVSRAYDRVVGQILRYMAWVRENLADSRPVRGIIVASEISEDLRLAASAIQNIDLVEYQISFSLKAVPATRLG